MYPAIVNVWILCVRTTQTMEYQIVVVEKRTNKRNIL